VVKHTNPCGAAVAADVAAAFERARASDPVSIYGGIVGVNRPGDRALLPARGGVLLEIPFAPAVRARAPGALRRPEQKRALDELRRTKKKLRVIELPCDIRGWPPRPTELRGILGALLVQEADLTDLEPSACKVVTRREPTAAEWQGLRFAWRVAKHVKSNA